MRLIPPVLAALAVLGLLAPAHAGAQGNGKGQGRPKEPKSSPTSAPAPAATPTSTTTSTTPSSTTTASAASTPVSSATPAIEPAGTPVDVQSPVVGFRQFGSWLDDASAPSRGEGYSSIGVGYWRLAGMSQTNVPMLGAGIGLTDRLGVGGSVPFYRVSYVDGSVSGMDDVYLSAKYNVLDPTLTLNEVGLSVGAVVEILSAGVPDGRVHFALPVSVEVRRLPFRVYGSAGYFTRGSMFSAGAVEWTAASGLTFTGGLTQSYSTTQDTTLDSLGVGRQRVDMHGGVAYPLGRIAATYVSVGRSLRSANNDGTQFGLSGGVSLRFRALRGIP